MMADEETRLTIADVWGNLFKCIDIIDLADNASYPEIPFDMFAATGLLLELSGAYQEVMASSDGESNSRIPISDKTRKRIVKVGKAWRKAGPERPPPPTIAKWWKALWEARNEVVQAFPPQLDSPTPAWWRPAVKLFIAADEASTGLVDESNAFLQWVIGAWLETGVAKQERGDYKNYSFPPSISSANRDMVCVMPKQQTPAVGCTMRSLSRNLALLPPSGIAQVSWFFNRAFGPQATRIQTPEREPMNLLLVPWPYVVDALSFKESRASPAPDRWRWFGVESHWLKSANKKSGHSRESPTRLIAFLESLLNTSREDVERIHGIVFPELALDWETAEMVANFLKKEKDVEFLIAGLSTNQKREKGNFVATFLFFEDESQRIYVHAERRKHHRWKLTTSQIRDYSLGASLDPGCHWWEDIELTARRLNVFALRQETTITTLICEDLARVDPCQGLLRAIGPSLVVALLMDGPQMITRWPGRYATALADDPGSSVLTLTSLALMNRQNAGGKFNECRVVALWKDEVTGEHRELSLPRDDHALCITLSSTQPPDRTIDGRIYPRTSWSLSGVRPIKARAEAP